MSRPGVFRRGLAKARNEISQISAILFILASWPYAASAQSVLDSDMFNNAENGLNNLSGLVFHESRDLNQNSIRITTERNNSSGLSVSQAGANNSLELTVLGSDNYFESSQVGVSNGITGTVRGEANTMVIHQSGSESRSTSSQAGFGNTIIIKQ